MIARYAAAALLLAVAPALVGARALPAPTARGAATVEHGQARAADARTLPGGFALRDIPTGQGQDNLTDFGYLPGGSVLTIGRNGRVTWVPKHGSPRTIRRLPTETSGDLGLVGLGIAPDYRTTHHIYLVRAVPSASAPPYRLRLSRFTVRGGTRPTGLAHERTLFEVGAVQHTHGMTTVLPARDGTLWVSVGDLRPFKKAAQGALSAMQVGKPAGKLLHVGPDGAGVRSNPYYQAAHPSSWRSRTWARGFRVPFRFSLDPATGRPIVGDVGWRSWEEVDLVRRGGNYKWPCWEGPARTFSYSSFPRCTGVGNTQPVWSYDHDAEGGHAVTGGVVYTGSRYPKRYRGAYFFGDYASRELWTMRFSARGALLRAPEDPSFGSGIGAPVKFGRAPNGDIVYADISSGHLRRLTH